MEATALAVPEGQLMIAAMSVRSLNQHPTGLEWALAGLVIWRISLDTCVVCEAVPQVKNALGRQMPRRPQPAHCDVSAHQELDGGFRHHHLLSAAPSRPRNALSERRLDRMLALAFIRGARPCRISCRGDL